MAKKKQVNAFVEVQHETELESGSGRITLNLAGDGTVDWETTDRTAFIQTITNDPNTLEIIGEAVGDSGPAIADATVVGAVNAIMAIEAVAITTLGRRIAPILKNVPLPVAMNACLVSTDEVKPIMEPAKRIIAKYTPAEWLEHQDLAVVIEHLGSLSAARFAECIKLANAIEEQKKIQEVTPGQPVNGKELKQEKQEGE